MTLGVASKSALSWCVNYISEKYIIQWSLKPIGIDSLYRNHCQGRNIGARVARQRKLVSLAFVNKLSNNTIV